MQDVVSAEAFPRGVAVGEVHKDSLDLLLADLAAAEADAQVHLLKKVPGDRGRKLWRDPQELRAVAGGAGSPAASAHEKLEVLRLRSRSPAPTGNSAQDDRSL